MMKKMIFNGILMGSSICLLTACGAASGIKPRPPEPVEPKPRYVGQLESNTVCAEPRSEKCIQSYFSA